MGDTTVFPESIGSITGPITPGTGAANLGKAEDAAHASADTGVMALAVRTDTATNRSGTDGDYEPLQISAGRLWASAVITDVVPGTAATNLGKAEDAAHASADTGVMALAVRTDTATNRSGTDGDYEPLQMSAGRLWTSATITDVVPGVAATNLGKAEDAAHASADVGVMALAVRTDTPAAKSGTDGDYEPLQVSGGHQWVALPVTTKVSTNFNRPADTTAYTANDAVNDNATAGGGSSTELTWTIPRSAGRIARVRIRKSDQTVATPTLRLWLYDAVFVSGAGDNEAFVHPIQDSIGYVDVAVVHAGSDDASGWTTCDIPVTAGTLYGQIQTLSAFTPASAETFTIALWVYPG